VFAVQRSRGFVVADARAGDRVIVDLSAQQRGHVSKHQGLNQSAGVFEVGHRLFPFAADRTGAANRPLASRTWSVLAFQPQRPSNSTPPRPTFISYLLRRPGPQCNSSTSGQCIPTIADRRAPSENAVQLDGPSMVRLSADGLPMVAAGHAGVVSLWDETGTMLCDRSARTSSSSCITRPAFAWPISTPTAIPTWQPSGTRKAPSPALDMAPWACSSGSSRRASARSVRIGSQVMSKGKSRLRSTRPLSAWTIPCRTVDVPRRRFLQSEMWVGLWRFAGRTVFWRRLCTDVNSLKL
jgi:hypothetical protein